MKLFQDIKVGERFEVGAHTFTAEDIKSFARRFDPQPFHLDEEAARHSHFGGLVASGWHTAAAWMRLMVDHRDRADAEMRARGEGVGRHGGSPGFRELKWMKPVYAGDTIGYVTEVTDLRTSQSHPRWGIMKFRTVGTNQNGDAVISFVSTVFVERRQ
ncbi:MAG TPA: MaoC family dehydratase [Pseudolabrys sp.]|nr:MaoC family dehydratase [Pseudolabrys sp.]